MDKTFFKERWITEDGLEQKLIVTYSIKYRDYQRKIRNSQIDRVVKVIESNPSKLKKSHQNDFTRFIGKISVTPNGEVAEKDLFSLDLEVIANEEAYHGFYAVYTTWKMRLLKLSRLVTDVGRLRNVSVL